MTSQSPLHSCFFHLSTFILHFSTSWHVITQKKVCSDYGINTSEMGYISDSYHNLNFTFMLFMTLVTLVFNCRWLFYGTLWCQVKLRTIMHRKHTDLKTFNIFKNMNSSLKQTSSALANIFELLYSFKLQPRRVKSLRKRYCIMMWKILFLMGMKVTKVTVYVIASKTCYLAHCCY